MFGLKKEDKQPQDSGPEMRVDTIPADFYGGANPVIKFKKVEKEVDLTPKKPVLTSAEKALLDKATAAGSGQPLHPANLLSSRKGLLILGGGLFVLFLIGAGVYYWLTSKPLAPAAPPPPVVSVQTPPITVTETEVTPPPTTTEAVIPIPVSLAETPLEYPDLLLADSADTDNDDLTNVAEELWRTDSLSPDTDGDGYNDGHEVYNLYNPIGKEPQKIIDSGLVTDYTNPVFGYKIYYPNTWAGGNVDPGYRDVLFSTLTGENIEVRVFDRETGQGFADWFAKWAPNEQYNDLLDLDSVFQDKGYRRKDYLVFYFYNDQNVFVIAYHTTDSATVNYRSVIKMLARSFRLPQNLGIENLAPRPIEGERPVEATTTVSL